MGLGRFPGGLIIIFSNEHRVWEHGGSRVAELLLQPAGNSFLASALHKWDAGGYSRSQRQMGSEQKRCTGRGKWALRLCRSTAPHPAKLSGCGCFGCPCPTVCNEV